MARFGIHLSLPLLVQWSRGQLRCYSKWKGNLIYEERWSTGGLFIPNGLRLRPSSIMLVVTVVRRKPPARSATTIKLHPFIQRLPLVACWPIPHPPTHKTWHHCTHNRPVDGLFSTCTSKTNIFFAPQEKNNSLNDVRKLLIASQKMAKYTDIDLVLTKQSWLTRWNLT